MTTDVTMIPAEQIAALQPHALAGLMPMMNASEFDALVADVRANGVREPVVMLDGAILDGRNRARACVATGRAMPTRTLPPTLDARRFVITKNLRRRNLSASQAAMVAARMVTTRQGPAAGDGDVTQEQAAATVNVSPRYVRDAAWLIEHHPDQADAVFAGTMTLAAAIRSTRPRPTRATTTTTETAPAPAPVAAPAAASTDPVENMLAIMEWLAAEPRDHAAVLARIGDRARVLIPALDDFARRLWDSADDEGRLR